MIPVAEPCLNEQDIENAIACLKSGWISSAGDNIPAFETRWAEYCQKRHGIAVFNGTVALEMAIKLLDLAPGDEVIMPSFTIISCAQAVTKNGGVPVLVDQEEIFWQMDVQQIESKITAKTRAIMVVHIYGHPVDILWQSYGHFVDILSKSCGSPIETSFMLDSYCNPMAILLK
jgi:perosamine synthetase